MKKIFFVLATMLLVACSSCDDNTEVVDWEDPTIVGTWETIETPDGNIFQCMFLPDGKGLVGYYEDKPNKYDPNYGTWVFFADYPFFYVLSNNILSVDHQGISYTCKVLQLTNEVMKLRTERKGDYTFKKVE